MPTYGPWVQEPARPFTRSSATMPLRGINGVNGEVSHRHTMPAQLDDNGDPFIPTFNDADVLAALQSFIHEEPAAEVPNLLNAGNMWGLGFDHNATLSSSTVFHVFGVTAASYWTQWSVPDPVAFSWRAAKLAQAQQADPRVVGIEFDPDDPYHGTADNRMLSWDTTLVRSETGFYVDTGELPSNRPLLSDRNIGLFSGWTEMMPPDTETILTAIDLEANTEATPKTGQYVHDPFDTTGDEYGQGTVTTDITHWDLRNAPSGVNHQQIGGAPVTTTGIGGAISTRSVGSVNIDAAFDELAVPMRVLEFGTALPPEMWGRVLCVASMPLGLTSGFEDFRKMFLAVDEAKVVELSGDLAFTCDWTPPRYRLLYAPIGKPLRVFPRDDGLVTASAGRVWPPPRSQQHSPRRGPGSYY